MTSKRVFHVSRGSTWVVAFLLAAIAFLFTTEAIMLLWSDHASAAQARGCSFQPATPYRSSATAGVPQGSRRGSRVSLGQNVPNPFNPQTEIQFNLPQAAKVKLRVFDVRGRLVATLVDGVRPAGPNRVQWLGVTDSGRKVASGVYVYRLEANGTAVSRRMTVSK